MKITLKVVLLILGIGFVIGWWMAQEQQRQKEKVESEAYANDPELVAIRKERARENQIDRWLDDMEGE